MKVPFFDLKKLYLEQKNEIDSAVSGALNSGHYILGAIGQEFESSFSQFLKKGSEEISGHTVGCNSGTDALILSLLASGIKPGEKVLVPSHTAIPTITAIYSAKAEPVFVDIHPDTWLIDIDNLFEKITPQVKAAVLVHLYGNMVDVEDVQRRLNALGREDIALIEDVAQATGAKLRGKMAGTIARFGAFSFYPTKNIGALGDGGAVFCRTKEDVDRVKFLRNYGQRDRYNAELRGGINSRLDEIQAAVLSTRLPKLNEWNKRKDKMMTFYQEAFTQKPLKFQHVTEGCTPAWHLGVVALETEKLRNDFMAFLEENGVQTIIHYPIPTHEQKAFQNGQKLKTTEHVARRIISLPMNAILTNSELERVVEVVKRFGF